MPENSVLIEKSFADAIAIIDGARSCPRRNGGIG